MKPERPTPKPHEVGAALRAIADAQGETLVGLSRLIGRRDGYLQRFVADGVPRVLPEDARLTLAKYLGIDERLLGVRSLDAALVPVMREAHAISMETPASLTDDDLLDAYERTSGEAGDSTASALLAEIKRRELDI